VREDAVITAEVPGSQIAEAVEQVGDRASAHGQDSGQYQQDEAVKGGTLQDRIEGFEDGAGALGNPLVDGSLLATSVAGVSGKRALAGAELFPALI
jgi:hypothetical protein